MSGPGGYGRPDQPPPTVAVYTVHAPNAAGVRFEVHPGGDGYEILRFSDRGWCAVGTAETVEVARAFADWASGEVR